MKTVCLGLFGEARFLFGKRLAPADALDLDARAVLSLFCRAESAKVLAFGIQRDERFGLCRGIRRGFCGTPFDGVGDLCAVEILEFIVPYLDLDRSLS